MPGTSHCAGLLVGLLIASASWGEPDRIASSDRVSFSRPVVMSAELDRSRASVVARLVAGREHIVTASAAMLDANTDKAAIDHGAVDNALVAIFAAHGLQRSRPTFETEPGNRALADQLGLSRLVTFEVANASAANAAAAALRSRADLFESAEPDALGYVHGVFVPNDPFFPWQYGLRNSGAAIGGIAGIAGADINAPAAWTIATGGSPVILAILDTGVSHSHPDLASRLVPGRNFIGDDPEATDDSPWVSHGTACAGIAAARANDNFGIAGVTWNSLVMPVRVADLWGNSSEVACAAGIVWAIDNGARVLNISLGFTTGTQVLRAAAEYAHLSGAVVVSSAGNAGAGVPIYYPARFSSVLCVTATDNRDQFAGFSCRGPEVDLSAPGVLIATTIDTNQSPNGHRLETGTSMAAPFVAGVACLLLETSPWLSGDEVKRILTETADDRGPAGWDEYYGHGRVNAGRALAAVADSDRFCIGDWNRDGVVTPEDLYQFFDDFFAGRADINGDGTTDTLDLYAFLAAYLAGC
ncbi:MAG: S8 family serine peptidase [Phycisphaeraceae bacterium]|nr:S8 family serine peptidase [Phycisphaeraceae bacterium]MBX3405697.1 S8 family serine peptidase [Phycisphaeraceae bacterium]